MHFSTLFAAVTSLSAVVAASPITSRQSNTTTPSNFYLVTTDQSTSAANSSALKNVSLTTLFSPYYQTNYLLRLIEPGYESVPTFNLSNGVLHSEDGGPHGVGEYVYNSTAVESGSELEFQPAYQGKGDLSLKDGFLLAVNGSAVGWTICVEELGQSVIEYKGTDVGCTPTYIQAVAAPPY
ncbi:hypothetical protein BDV97DRAFT_292462 [Delphinella strobiligena]|nr:hypothetical protein BDV97DRAFT_292462 [Delphinella strobiligena]